MFLLKNIDQ